MNATAVSAMSRPKVLPRRRITAGFMPFLKEHVPGAFKATLPSPAMASRGGFQQGLTDAVYPTRHELLRDLLPIYQDEMRALAADEVAYVQMDEGFISYVNDGWRAGLKAQGLDPAQELAADIAAENACWDLLPPEHVVRAMHICRGSRTTARGTGDYAWLAEHLFDQLHVDRFLLEYDSELVGGFEPLRFVPPGKVVVLGLVSSKTPALESEDALLRRIEAAGKFVPVEQLAISPQCGFGGSADNAFITPDQQWRKLELWCASPSVSGATVNQFG